MIALTGEREVPASVTDDGGADGHSLISAGQTDALFDVEFDERPDARQRAGSAPMRSGSRP